MEMPNLPKEQEVTVYWYYDTVTHSVRAFTFQSKMSGMALLGSETLTLAVPQVDVHQKQVEVLEQELEDTRAEYQNRITEIQRQISELKAIESESPLYEAFLYQSPNDRVLIRKYESDSVLGLCCRIQEDGWALPQSSRGLDRKLNEGATVTWDATEPTYELRDDRFIEARRAR